MGIKSFSKMRIKSKIIFIITAAILLSACTMSGYSIYQSIARYQKDSAESRAVIMAQARSKLQDLVNSTYTVLEKAYNQSATMESIQKIYGDNLKGLVNIPYALIEREYRLNGTGTNISGLSGGKNFSEAQKQALETVKIMKYGQSGYFWINDTYPRMIMHPIVSQLNGQDLTRFSENGQVVMAEGTDRPMFQEFVRVCRESPNGGGFVSYLWPHPADKSRWVRKLSYVRLFSPWDWIVGTGVYVDQAEAEAKERALETIGSMRYGDRGYFWINDTQCKMVMHPIVPDLNGQDLTNFTKDGKMVMATGTNRPMFQEFVRVCRESPTGDGFVGYEWPDPNDTSRWVPKLSYVRLFKPWNWIVGSGVYLDHLQTALQTHKDQLWQSVREQVLFTILAALFLMALSFTLAYLMSGTYIEEPIKKAMAVAEAIKAGDLSRRLDMEESHDEISRLGNAVDDMADQLVSYIKDLDGKVRERTAELKEMNESLKGEIEERRKIEIELRQAKEEAEAANRAKTDFLARMSHEIRTPMNAILGMAELLQETELNREQEDYVETFSTSGELLLGIINDVLDFSKIEADQIEFEQIPFDMRDLVEDTCRLMAFKAHEKGIELACHLDPDLHVARIGDPMRLRQILLNFLGNAVKFTHEGEVVLRVKNGAAGDGVVVFEVRDTGIGIEPDKVDKVFERFAQADTSTTRQYGGTGLGLAINKKLIEYLHGDIQVESKVGQGTTFRFNLRYEKGEAIPKTFSATVSELRGLKVLVVDDNATNRRIYLENLTRWGAEVTACESGPQAIEVINQGLLKNEPFQLALIDCNMPGMDGFQLTEKLKVAGKVPPCMMMFSSTDTADIKQHARRLGVTHHLTKPIKQADMQAAILAALGKAGIGTEKSPRDFRVQDFALPALDILLVEDYRPNQKIVESFLRKTAAGITIAENGKIGLEKFKHKSFDLILMDMEMPVMDGLEATRAIRAWEEEQGLKPTPIVALTAHVFSEHRKMCTEAGCNGFMPKPIKKKALLETLYNFSKEAGGQGKRTGLRPGPAPHPGEIKTITTPKSTTVMVDDDLSGVIDDYIRAVKNDCLNLKQALSSGDLEKIRGIGYDLQGSGAGYGLDPITEIGRTLGRMASARELEDISEQIEKLSSYIENIKLVSARAYTVKIDEDLEPVIDDYVRAVKADCRSLVKALRKRDLETVYGIGHDLKGSGNGYGLNQVTASGRAICDQARAKNLAGLVKEIKNLNHYIQNVILIRS